MSWARIDDNFHDHPKVVGLDVAAVGLWTLSLCWAHRNATAGPAAGVIPTGTARRFAGARARKLACELVDAGLWDEVAGGWSIHDFTEYLAPERDRTKPGTTAELSAKRREAGRRGGRASQQRKQHGQHPGQLAGEQTEQVLPSPVVASNEATPEPEPEPVLLARKRATSTPDVFPLTEALRAWGRDHCPHVIDPAAETAQFLDYHRGKGSTQKDWTATWRTWMRNAEKYARERAVPASDAPTWAQERGFST